MDDLCDIIASIIRSRMEQGRLPLHAMLREIADRYEGDDLDARLEALEALGIVRSGDTINSTYYILND